MTEVSRPQDLPSGEQSATQSAALSRFGECLHTLAIHPSGGDERISAFALAATEEINQPESRFKDAVAHVLSLDTIDTIGGEESQITYQANKLLRICDKFALRQEWQDSPENPRFPEDFLDTSSWRKLFLWVVDDSTRKSEFVYDLKVRDVASNVPQRYVTIPFTLNLLRATYPNRFTEPPQILDGGCSQNLGLTHLASGIPFQPVTIFKNKKDKEEKDALDSEKTGSFNSILAHGLKIGQSWGVDKVSPWDRGAQEWAKACGKYPSEFLGDKCSADIDKLYHLEASPNVNFNRWDFAEVPEKGQLDFPDKSMDLVFVSNALYLIAASRRKAAIANLLRFAKPDGLFVWQEFASLGRSNTPRFYADPHARPYQHRSFVTDLAERHPRPKEIIRYKGGRCTEGRLGSFALATMDELDDPLDALISRTTA